MPLIATAINLAERLPLPDSVTLSGIDFLVGRTRRRLEHAPFEDEARFVDEMEAYPVAVHTDKANSQHYELPPEFFARVLGPARKYSCCLYPSADSSLAEAEQRALAATVEHADLQDGQRILELGCGWGSLSLYMAQRFPNAHIVAVSNSRPQRLSIEARAADLGLRNLTILTADMNDLTIDRRVDRIVSVEMFEHMSNWKALLARVRGWLNDDGRLFLHVFTHRSRSYRFNETDPADWIAQHFFTGGIMPAHDLPHRATDQFSVEAEWRWSGRHYQRTAMDWLANMDAQKTEIDAILKSVYGADADLWRRRWRLFFLSTAGLFGHADGEEWGVGHYRLKPSAAL